MKQLVIISGKGGTGKTSIAAALATLAADSISVVMADCDVDAANLGLLLPGNDGAEVPFAAGRRARVDPERCSGCGLCQESCRFAAITLESGVATVDALACEGCGVCELVCPDGAVEFADNIAGIWLERRTGIGVMVHARLGIAQDNSGKLVAMVRQRAREIAERDSAALILVDGPPGIGCPVHAALSGCDLALVVTEPTPSGEHDLARVLKLTEHFGMKAAVVVNKHDLSPQITDRIHRLVLEHGASWLGTIPFEPNVPRALARGELPLAVAPVAEALKRIWRDLELLMELDGSSAPLPLAHR
jgi:MinD superfamily P-loop ATPase